MRVATLFLLGMIGALALPACHFEARFSTGGDVSSRSKARKKRSSSRSKGKARSRVRFSASARGKKKASARKSVKVRFRSGRRVASCGRASSRTRFRWTTRLATKGRAEYAAKRRGSGTSSGVDRTPAAPKRRAATPSKKPTDGRQPTASGTIPGSTPSRRPTASGTIPGSAPVVEVPPPVEPPETPPDNVFGYEKPVRGCFEGLVYSLEKNTKRLPSSYSGMTPFSAVYACEWDVPPRKWQTGFPGVADRFEWFAIRYSGTFAVQKAGSWKFRISSDDGTKLIIDGKPVITNDGVHPPREKSGTVNLAAGDHTMVLEYFQGPRYYINLQLWATPPGGEEGVFSVR